MSHALLHPSTRERAMLLLQANLAIALAFPALCDPTATPCHCSLALANYYTTHCTQGCGPLSAESNINNKLPPNKAAFMPPAPRRASLDAHQASKPAQLGWRAKRAAKLWPTLARMMRDCLSVRRAKRTARRFPILRAWACLPVRRGTDLSNAYQVLAGSAWLSRA